MCMMDNKEKHNAGYIYNTANISQKLGVQPAF